MDSSFRSKVVKAALSFCFHERYSRQIQVLVANPNCGSASATNSTPTAVFKDKQEYVGVGGVDHTKKKEKKLAVG